MDKKFTDEIKKYSYDDLKLIYDTQQDLYSSEEMKIIQERMDEMLKTGNLNGAQDFDKKALINQRKLPKKIICPNDEVYRLITASEHYEKTKELSDEEKSRKYLIIAENSSDPSKSNSYYEIIENTTPSERVIINEINDQNELLEKNNHYLKELLNIGYFFKILAIIIIAFEGISIVLQIL